MDNETNAREMACKTPWDAYEYALTVDKKPHTLTRASACLNPIYALRYAENIDKRPRSDTRLAASRKPEEAYFYALCVDHGPHEITRKGACRKAQTAYWYALEIDQGPREDTRNAASVSYVCPRPWQRSFAWEYAKDVDKKPHVTTFEVVKEEIIILEYYLRRFKNHVEFFKKHLKANEQYYLEFLKE